jgi:hypothetical protein
VNHLNDLRAPATNVTIDGSLAHCTVAHTATRLRITSLRGANVRRSKHQNTKEHQKAQERIREKPTKRKARENTKQHQSTMSMKEHKHEIKKTLKHHSNEAEIKESALTRAMGPSRTLPCTAPPYVNRLQAPVSSESPPVGWRGAQRRRWNRHAFTPPKRPPVHAVYASQPRCATFTL